jgi:hypothetical protein
MLNIRKRFNNNEFDKVLKDDPIAMQAFKRLCVAGREDSTKPNLIALIGQWCCGKEIFEQRKKDLARLKERLDKLVTASENLGDEIDSLAQDSLEIFGRYSIGEILSRGISRDGEGWLIPPSRQPLGGLSDQLRETSVRLRELREAWGKEYSLRTLTPTTYLAILYFYCCEVAQAEGVSYQDLAEVLEKAAAVHGIPEQDSDLAGLLKKNVEGFKERPESAHEAAQLRDLIRIYVENVPTGIPTFNDWMAILKATETKVQK